MIDCPTGAIGRDPEGEVFIRASLCTGCGHCAKACPWENIRMAPRPADHAQADAPVPLSPQQSADIAVKCDLCREYQAPACVQSCPTGALVRLDPSRDIAEIGDFLGPSPASGSQPAPGSQPATAAGHDPATAYAIRAQPWALAIALAGIPWALSMHAAGSWQPGTGVGLAFGWLAGLSMLALAGYGLGKRMVNRFMKPRERLSAARRSALAEERTGDPARGDRPRQANAARSRVRPLYLWHIALGMVSLALVAAHAGARMPASPAGAAHAAFWLLAGFGVLGELGYRLLPARLSRLERRGALPEDLAAERAALLSRLYRQASGAEPRVKRLLADIVIPYARSLSGSLALLLSGRDLAGEEARLRALLHAREHAHSPGARPLDMREIARIAVEIRALPMRRLASFALRAWLPLHLLASAVFGACLLLHILIAVTGG
jgi:ferredoxin